MKKFDRLFNRMNMNYRNVIVFAAVAGIYCGLINCVDFLHDTSFTDIAVTYEWWVLFALIVVSNCSKPLEAGIKNLLFFLISQPLVYLVEIALGKLDAARATQYYTQMWLPLTFATLPGGIIAYYAKKQNIPGAIILATGLSIMAFMGLFYSGLCLKNPPRHLITVLFCFIMPVLCIFSIQKGKKERITAFLTMAIVIIAVVIFAAVNHLTIFG